MSFRHFLPVIVLAALMVLLAIGLTLKPGDIPSPLIGKPRPALQLPALGSGEVPTELSDGAYLVNFWASWCLPCLAEHPVLMRIAESGTLPIIGVNYKDTRAAATRWLDRHRNPFTLVLQDADGASSIDWGVYGVPETFLVSADGTVLYKHVGALTEEAWNTRLLPLLESGS